MEAGELAARARRWREAASCTRAEADVLRALGSITWRGGTADAFRAAVLRRVGELRALAEEEDAVADLFDRLAAAAQAA